MQQGVDAAGGAAGVDLRRCYEKAESFQTREAGLEGETSAPLAHFLIFMIS